MACIELVRPSKAIAKAFSAGFHVWPTVPCRARWGQGIL
jgi:hypothetical protein